MFTGFIKCDCNGVCIEVNPFICTTSTSTSTSTSTTTTTTTEACNRWGYEYLSYTCTSCEIIEYSSLYNSNPLTLDNFYQYGDIVITPYAYLGCDTGISDASIPDTGVATCEEIDCTPTTTTTTIRPKTCKRYVIAAEGEAPTFGSWTALDCEGNSVDGITTEFNSITPCIDIDTFVPINTFIKQIIDCNELICQELLLQALVGEGSWTAADCVGNSVGGILPSEGTIINTGCINISTLNIVNGIQTGFINC